MFIGDVWAIEESNWNTGIINWPYDKDYQTDNPKVLISWGRSPPGKPYYLMKPTMKQHTANTTTATAAATGNTKTTPKHSDDDVDKDYWDRIRRNTDATATKEEQVIVARAREGDFLKHQPWPYTPLGQPPKQGEGHARNMKYFLQGHFDTDPNNASHITAVEFPDLRTFSFRDEIRFHGVAMFGDGDHGHERQGMIYGTLHYHHPSDTIYTVPEECQRLLIDELGKHSEKNWSPFQFDYLLSYEGGGSKSTNTGGERGGEKKEERKEKREERKEKREERKEERKEEREREREKKEKESSLLYDETVGRMRNNRREREQESERDMRERERFLRGSYVNTETHRRDTDTATDNESERVRGLTITVEDQLKYYEKLEKKQQAEADAQNGIINNDNTTTDKSGNVETDHANDSESDGNEDETLDKENGKVTGILPLHLKYNDMYVDYHHLQKSYGSHIHSIQLFVHSINPHRIVYGSNLHDNYPYWSDTEALDRESPRVFPSEGKGMWGGLNLTTVCLSEYKPTPERPEFWSYGNPHGGTPSVLIKTKYGPRYLNIFHSQGKYSINYILTYFMGAYLFEPIPPFRITHVTPNPIIPNSFYNETYGWAYRAIDYIVFPMGMVMRDDVLYLSSGRNDRSGWMATMNIAGLVDYMIEVEFDVKQNNLNDLLLKEYEALTQPQQLG